MSWFAYPFVNLPSFHPSDTAAPEPKLLRPQTPRIIAPAEERRWKDGQRPTKRHSVWFEFQVNNYQKYLISPQKKGSKTTISEKTRRFLTSAVVGWWDSIVPRHRAALASHHSMEETNPFGPPSKGPKSSPSYPGISKLSASSIPKSPQRP